MTINRYRRDMRQPVRALFTGIDSPTEFRNIFLGVVDRGIHRAWARGAKKCGIDMNDLTSTEQDEINQIIEGEALRIGQLSDFIVQVRDGTVGTKTEKLQKIYRRIERWTNRFTEAENKARVYSCGNPKLKWVRGKTSDSCITCRSLDGVVKRASYWREKGVFPQSPPNPSLVCQGRGCRCSLQPTNDPISKGKLPGLKKSLNGVEMLKHYKGFNYVHNR